MSNRRNKQPENLNAQTEGTTESTHAMPPAAAPEQIQKDALRLMKEHSLKEIFATSDGYFFTQKEYALEYAGKKNLEIYTFQRSEDQNQ